MNNPLLDYTSFPKFSKICPEHVTAAIDIVLANNRARTADLLQHNSLPTWENLVAPIDEMDNQLRRTWSPVSHLNGVLNSQELRDAYNACLPKLSLYASEMGQNEALYRAYKAVAESEDKLNIPQRKALENSLRDFHLSGVDLPEADKLRFKEINQRLSQLASNFNENVLDATQAWTKFITNIDKLAGLPTSALDLLRQNAQQRELDGWMLTLDFSSYLPVIVYAQDRGLRQEIYIAYVTRASDQGPYVGRWDNSAVISETLALRHELANLLGFANFAELSLFTKMARTTDTVLNFLENLAQRSHSQALQEFAELTAFAYSEDGLTQLEAWDVAYYSERLRQTRYAISQEELRPYFPATKVISGLLAVAERLFSIKIKEIKELETWHPDVICYEIQAKDGTVRGHFYLDMYVRAHKRSGAWMDAAIDRMTINDQVQIPAAYLVCNFAPPVNGRPALLSHEEVRTLFHEFGHGIHHLLTLINYLTISGINGVVWDAVELPSQFMENWCWEREAIELFSGHWESGDSLPEVLYVRMREAKNFQSAMQLARQLELALFDFRLHRDYDPALGPRVLEILSEVRQKVAVLTYPIYNRLPHSFSHIFSGGYAAGYYSYKWAEVLSADAFSLFEERGLFNPINGEAFRECILEQGGSVDANELFKAFRGRDPSIDPLLRHSGIAV